MKTFFIKIANTIGLTDKLVRRRIDAFLQMQATSARTLDVGGGSGPYKKYFPKRVCIDSEAGDGVDFVGDAHDLSIFKDGEFEAVLCTEVLEHLHTPQKAIDEMRRVLKQGGMLILTTRFIFPLHNIPGDYFRFTRYGLAHLLRDWKSVEITEEGTTMDAFAVLCERMGFQTETLGTKFLSVLWLIEAKIVRFFSFLITKEYGEVGGKNKTKNILTSGYFVIARK
ncbi:MAG: class I SAM-dependent methyltransferase [bacterium]|nr:class I SAM-dependent methyltransferase [bacterium]